MTHYEIHEKRENGEFRLVKGAFPSTWAGVGNSSFTPMEFDTRGGARNYIHKHLIDGRGLRIVRVAK